MVHIVVNFCIYRSSVLSGSGSESGSGSGSGFGSGSG